MMPVLLIPFFFPLSLCFLMEVNRKISTSGELYQFFLSFFFFLDRGYMKNSTSLNKRSNEW